MDDFGSRSVGSGGGMSVAAVLRLQSSFSQPAVAYAYTMADSERLGTEVAEFFSYCENVSLSAVAHGFRTVRQSLQWPQLDAHRREERVCEWLADYGAGAPDVDSTLLAVALGQL